MISDLENYAAKLPPGLKDFFFAEAQERRSVERRLADLLAATGFSEVITPTIEYSDVFLLAGKTRYGRNSLDEKVYRFLDRDGSLLALRADFTAQIARIAASRFGALSTPIRLFYSGRVFRAEPLDLAFGRCKIVVAGRPEDAGENFSLRSTLRVGTQYPKIARRHFDRRGTPAEIIVLQGSVELSVLAGLVDVIVDIVETGATLRENGLVVHEEILSSSARLIVNKASHKLKLAAIANLLRSAKL